jgi:hypothetical protein
MGYLVNRIMLRPYLSIAAKALKKVLSTACFYASINRQYSAPTFARYPTKNCLGPPCANHNCGPNPGEAFHLKNGFH